jgi:hypothetical protein
MPPPYPDITVPMRPYQIEAALQDLASTFGSLCTRTVFGTPTFEGRKHSYIKIANGSGANRPAILVIAGVHANEWAPPDALVTFARNLLVSYSTGKDVTFPSIQVTPLKDTPVTYPPWRIKAAEVNAIVSAVDLYLFPNVNPDGREYELTHLTEDGWRKNRRPFPNQQFGVDLNRNFEIIRQFEDYYDMALYKKRYKLNRPAGTDPKHDDYRGGGTTEPEVSHVQQLLDTLPIRYHVDLHMFGRKILFSWGMEEDGDDLTMTWENQAQFAGKRDGLKADDALWHAVPPPAPVDYKEYLPDDLPHKIRTRARFVANAMHDEILRAATGSAAPQTSSRQQVDSTYEVGQSAFLYLPDGGPNSGCSDDYACSRQFKLPNRKPIFAYTVETGHPDELGKHCDYTDPPGHFRKINREIHAALYAMLKIAAKGCLIATATSSENHPDVVFLRTLRDERLRATPRGARVADLLDRVYYSFSPAVARYLTAHPRARNAVRVLVIRPLVAVLRRILGAGEGGG